MKVIHLRFGADISTLQSEDSVCKIYAGILFDFLRIVVEKQRVDFGEVRYDSAPLYEPDDTEDTE